MDPANPALRSSTAAEAEATPPPIRRTSVWCSPMSVLVVGFVVRLRGAADRAHPAVRDVLEGGARWNTALGVALRRVVDVAAGDTDPLLGGDCLGHGSLLTRRCGWPIGRGWDPAVGRGPRAGPRPGTPAPAGPAPRSAGCAGPRCTAGPGPTVPPSP